MIKRLILSITSLTFLSTGSALAAPSVHFGATTSSNFVVTKGVPAPGPAGDDVSYPQCPWTADSSSEAFAIVGLNGGVANNFNSCFNSEYSWAQTSAGTLRQPKASVYVNTGNPGSLVTAYDVTDWPYDNTIAGTSTVNTYQPYGACQEAPSSPLLTLTGQLVRYGNDDPACGWQYGFNKAYADYQTASLDGVTNPAGLNWWLDVETGNSWDDAQLNNLAVLEGMMAGFTYAGVPAGPTHYGIYSTRSQWNTIVGTTPGSVRDKVFSLTGLSTWLPGATTLAQARANCSLAPLFGTAGTVTLTQYTNQTDSDYSCLK